jgi:hypothetical protein
VIPDRFVEPLCTVFDLLGKPVLDVEEEPIVYVAESYVKLLAYMEYMGK